MGNFFVWVQAYLLFLLLVILSSAAVAFPVMLALGVLHLHMATGIPALGYIETLACVFALSLLALSLRKEPEVKISRRR